MPPKCPKAVLFAVLANLLLGSACSRTRGIDPIARPEHALVTFPLGTGIAHQITDKAAIARIKALVNDDLDGWRDIRLYGKSPVARAVLRLDSTGQHVSVAIGDPWLERGTLLKDIPLARERELLELVGGGPASAGP